MHLFDVVATSCIAIGLLPSKNVLSSVPDSRSVVV